MARGCYGPTCRLPKAIKATKVLQADLIRQAKRLRRRPELAVPECQGNHRGCPFPKIETQIRRVADIADDKRRLEKLSKRGDPLVRAYAGTLLLTHAEGAPYLATARVGDTDVPFASRGKTRREMLLGVQHFDDPFLRLLSVATVAEKRGLFVFSLSDRMVCTGREPKPPEGYILQVLRESGYVLKPSNGGYACAHSGDGEAVLSVRWPAADSQVEVCQECVSDEESLGQVLAHRMVAPRSASIFQVAGSPYFECEAHDGDCPLHRESFLPEAKMWDYLTGAISDRAALEDTVDRVISDARQGILYATGGVCYGDDVDAFIGSLRGTKSERAAANAILSAADSGWVGNGTTLGKILAAHWDEHALEALEAVSDENVANGILERNDAREPAVLIRMAVEEFHKVEVAATLPAYAHLPPVASLANSLAHVCRFKGKDAAVRKIDGYRSNSRVERVVAYAFLLALGEGSGKAWKYARDEADLAEFLKSFASEMITVTGEAYHEALQNILTASGSGETVKLPKS